MIDSNQSLEVQIDKGHSNVLPTITIQDADENPPKPTNATRAQPPAASAEVPGAIPSSPVGPIPDWYRVGWRQVSGIDEPALTEGEQKDGRVLDLFLSDQFYGAWYHNAAVIVFVSLIIISSSIFLSIASGCLRLAFPHSLSFGVGMAFHTSCSLQHVL